MFRFCLLATLPVSLRSDGHLRQRVASLQIAIYAADPTDPRCEMSPPTLIAAGFRAPPAKGTGLSVRPPV